MGRLVSQWIQGLVFLLSGILSGALIIYFALYPSALSGVHPLPLLLLLGLTMLIAFWQARVHLG